MTVNLLLCDTFPGLLPSYIPSYVSMFTNLFDKVRHDVDYHVFRTMDGELPNVEEIHGLCLITGCNRSAYDTDGWIRSLLNWIVRADERHIKLTGICFGHQCIAEALGGHVARASQGWGTGLRESLVVDAAARRYFPDGRMRLLYNHHDQVTVLPPHAELVATSSFCPNESFRIGSHILTFQGHPEYIPEYSHHLLEHFAADEPIETRQTALKSLHAGTHDGLAVARWLLDFAEGID